jgi:hypothetical protein
MDLIRARRAASHWAQNLFNHARRNVLSRPHFFNELGLLRRIVVTVVRADYGWGVHPNIKSVEELKGKRIGISRFEAASHMRVLNVLPRYGLNERDITFLQIGDTPARLIALLGNSIDATLATPPDHLHDRELRKLA